MFYFGIFFALAFGLAAIAVISVYEPGPDRSGDNGESMGTKKVKLTEDELVAVRARWKEVQAAQHDVDIPRLLDHVDAVHEETRALHDALLTLAVHIHMRAHPDRISWFCPLCHQKNKSLTALEEGHGHADNCPYARAHRALRGDA